MTVVLLGQPIALTLWHSGRLLGLGVHVLWVGVCSRLLRFTLLIFGAGRLSCIGILMIMYILWISHTLLLWMSQFYFDELPWFVNIFD